jgi:hypothetical protein
MGRSMPRSRRNVPDEIAAGMFLLLPRERRHAIIDEALPVLARSLIDAHASGTIGALVEALVAHPCWRYLQAVPIGSNFSVEPGPRAAPPAVREMFEAPAARAKDTAPARRRTAAAPVPTPPPVRVSAPASASSFIRSGAQAAAQTRRTRFSRGWPPTRPPGGRMARISRRSSCFVLVEQHRCR